MKTLIWSRFCDSVNRLEYFFASSLDSFEYYTRSFNEIVGVKWGQEAFTFTLLYHFIGDLDPSSHQGHSNLLVQIGFTLYSLHIKLEIVTISSP